MATASARSEDTVIATPAHAVPSAPHVEVVAVLPDVRGRLLLTRSAARGGFALPGGAVGGAETPEEALARHVRGQLGRDVRVGRLLAVNSLTPGAAGGSGGPARIVHVHLAGPVPEQEPGGHPWEEACALIPAPDAPVLRAAVAALNTGSVAHLRDGVVQPGSGAGLGAADRAALEHAHALDTASHRANRPKALTASKVLFTDSAGRVLLVLPSYRDDGRWHLPGGGVESDLGETPYEAARREVREELGLDLAPGRLLAVNWSAKRPYPARVGFLYDGGVLDGATLARIRLDPAELRLWRMVSRTELPGLVGKSLRRRIEACLTARHEGTGPLELYAGRPRTGG
ncbi:NUDIX hydrolase [Streptomyces sp. NPDC090022]|uniref:NUDIX hydrolase n=1 Tax=Streptomyces sp. NPDC090022 TaxID=3365920 RepID=UPI00381D943F